MQNALPLPRTEADAIADALEKEHRRPPKKRGGRHGRLVLSRSAGQAIAVDGRAVITVQHAGNGKASLVIEAPHSTRVLRCELVDLDEPHEKSDGQNGRAA